MHKCQVIPGTKQAFYSVEAAAAYLTIGTTTVYKAIEHRQLKHTRFGKSIRIKHEDLMKWVEEQTKPTLAEVEAKNYNRKNKFKGRQPIRKQKRGRPPLWPPTTIADLRRLAKRIEKKMLKEEAATTVSS